MKRIGMAVWAVGMLATQANAAEMPVLKTDKEKLSYVIGVSTGRNFKKAGTDVDLDLMMKGIKDGMAGEKLPVTEKELRKVMNGYQSDVRRTMLLERRQAMEENRKKGEAFLAENKAKPGVVTLPSGVQYLIVKAGNGKMPLESDMVEVRYRGTLLDGTEFDATEDKRTANLKLSALPPGWKEAVKLMPTGSTWKIFIPSNLAYGERGVGTDIGPNETLIYETELVGIR
ncbi:MAG TPA: FKBP-type peptidyl-prolyl cis-trans isomerase [Gallionella sp.]|nr:FKBP-type peptidyl-prolyl cis-trans isomerase [Gallionella sp.]